LFVVRIISFRLLYGIVIDGHLRRKLIWQADLRRTLKAYASYYNRVRTHLSLSKDAPLFRRSQMVGDIAAIPILGGLHHLYVRV